MESMSFSQQIRKIIGPLHKRYRTEKLNCFFVALRPAADETLLDVGGGLGIVGEFEPLYKYFRSVQVVNLDAKTMSDKEHPHVTVSNADGCALPFADQSFDWVFSNAVIEHVGGAARQHLFASEIRRVARKGYFVATPNRNFPLDPHTLLPFYQFLSPQLQRKVCRFSPAYIKEYEPIDLLSSRDLQTLFPGAVIRKMGMRLFPNNLVAYRSFPTPQ
jgi:ubiquinone/menaquinone biosynthesis C-methylase UbiE